MKPTIYIETTIAGHLMSRLSNQTIVAGQMLETRDWWQRDRQHFECYTSQAVLSEASRGDPQAAAERLEVLSALPLLNIEPGVDSLANL